MECKWNHEYFGSLAKLTLQETRSIHDSMNIPKIKNYFLNISEILEVHIQESLADPSGRIDIIVVPVEAETMLNSLVDQSCVNDTLNEPP